MTCYMRPRSDINMILSWKYSSMGIWTQRNGLVFDHIQCTIETCINGFRNSFSMAMHRAKPSLKEGMHLCLDNVLFSFFYIFSHFSLSICIYPPHPIINENDTVGVFPTVFGQRKGCYGVCSVQKKF